MAFLRPSALSQLAYKKRVYKTEEVQRNRSGNSGHQTEETVVILLLRGDSFHQKAPYSTRGARRGGGVVGGAVLCLVLFMCVRECVCFGVNRERQKKTAALCLLFALEASCLSAARSTWGIEQF